MRHLCPVLKRLGYAEAEYVILSGLLPQATRIHQNFRCQRFRVLNGPRISYRAFSTQLKLLNETKRSGIEPMSKISTTSASKVSDPPVHRAPEEDLPSHREAQRWTSSKRIHALMDDLMQKLSVASQRINKYTGTDYTGIEALRREIKDQG
jgi:hypothetical protein